MHAQVPVRVNVWIDEGVAPLVKALNRIPDLETFESCQCGEGRQAEVYFQHREPGLTLFLGQWLADELNETDEDYRISVVWSAGAGSSMVLLEVRCELVKRLARAISTLARRMACSGGRSGTSPSSWKACKPLPL